MAWFNSVEAFKEALLCNDIEFTYDGRRYSICPINGKLIIGEIGCDEVEYADVDELLRCYRFSDGNALADCIGRIEF